MAFRSVPTTLLFRIWSVWHQRTLSAQYECCYESQLVQKEETEIWCLLIQLFQFSQKKKISKKKSTILNREHQKFLALVLPKRQPHRNMSFKQLLIQDWCNFSVRLLFLKETRPYHRFQSHEYIVCVRRWIKFIEFLMCHNTLYLYLTSCSNMFFCNVLGLAAWDGINPDAVEKSDLCISTSSSIVMYW